MGSQNFPGSVGSIIVGSKLGIILINIKQMVVHVYTFLGI